MIRRLCILAAKELRQHRALLLGIAGVFATLGGIAYWGAHLSGRSTSVLSETPGIVSMCMPIAGSILGNRMLVREYQGQAQRFLEALPLRRWEALFSKYAVGAGTLVGILLAYTLASACFNGHAEPRFLLILAARTFGFTLACWSVFFCMGLFGRLRLAAYVTLWLGFYLLGKLTAFDLHRFGPFALIDKDVFPFERFALPYRALGESLALSVAFFALGLTLGLSQEGSLAERLSRRASPREFLAVVTLLIAECLAVSWIPAQPKLVAFEFTSEAVLKKASGQVQVMFVDAELEPAAALALGALGSFADRVQHDLGVAAPPLRVAHNPTLDGRKVRTRSQSTSSGVLLDVNLAASDFDPQTLIEPAAHQAFSQLSKGRAPFEPNHWLLDGMSKWYGTGSQPELAALDWRRAAFASSGMTLDESSFSHWERTLEAVGEENASSIACTFVDFLMQRHGKEVVLALTADLLARPSVHDFASWLVETPLPDRVARLSAESWPSTLQGWRAELSRRAPELLGAELSARAGDRALLSVESSDIGADIVYSLSGPALGSERRCAVLSVYLAAYDLYANPEFITRRDLLWRAGEARVDGRFRGVFHSGERSWVAVDCEVPELHASVRLSNARFEVP